MQCHQISVLLNNVYLDICVNDFILFSICGFMKLISKINIISLEKYVTFPSCWIIHSLENWASWRKFDEYEN